MWWVGHFIKASWPILPHFRWAFGELGKGGLAHFTTSKCNLILLYSYIILMMKKVMIQVLKNIILLKFVMNLLSNRGVKQVDLEHLDPQAK